MLAPNVGPPRTARSHSHDRAFFLASEIPSGFWRRTDFAMLFVGVVMLAELIQEKVRFGKGRYLLGSKDGGEPLLPEVVGAFDFALGLRSRRKTQGDIVKAQSRAKLSKSIGHVSEKEGMVIDIESQRQAASDKSAGKKIQMSQETFSRVNPCQGQQPTVVVDNFD